MNGARRSAWRTAEAWIDSGVEPADAVQEAELLVLELERGRDLLAQDLGVEQVLHADADARGLVGVGRPDAAARGADLQRAEVQLGGLVEHAVPRHDEVRVARDAQARRPSGPRASSSSSSSHSTSGSSTTPLPSTQSTPGKRMPLGSSRNLNVSSPTCTVCPALLPPW